MPLSEKSELDIWVFVYYNRDVNGSTLLPIVKEGYMSRAKRLFCFGFLFVFMGTFSLFSDNRYALVIGNSNYRSAEIASLSNPANDATDVAAVLSGMGFNVTLKTDIGLLDMINTITDFSLNLGRSGDSEGFFWFAGHGISVRGIHYLLPVDVEPANENLIVRGAYSVDDLMEEIGNARNKTNLIVIDACRNNLLPTGRSLGTRGLSVLAADDARVSMNKIVYSTLAGRTAADGVPGSRNSPFAQAFIEKMQSPESFEDVFVDIRDETLRLTRGEQQPYAMGSFAVKGYALNPLPPAPPPAIAAAPAETAAPIYIIQQAPAAGAKAEPTAFTLDGKKVFSIGIMPSVNPGTFRGSAIGSIGLSFTFYEKYRTYNEFFPLPNSFFFYAEYMQGASASHHNPSNIDQPGAAHELNPGFQGFIFGLGAHYKIRLGESQKFIFNFGPSILLFAGEETMTKVFPDNSAKIIKRDNWISPGIGIATGISLRLSPLIALGLGVDWKFSLIGTKYDFTFDDEGENVRYLTEKGVTPNIINMYLGLSFWWPR